MQMPDLRVIFLYEWKLGHSAGIAARNVNKAFGENTANERTIRRWFVKFRSGDTDLQNEARGHRPVGVSDDVLLGVVEADPRKTCREIAAEVGVHHTTVVRRLAALGKVKKLDMWLPHELTTANKTRRLEVCTSLLARNKREPLQHRIVTCDEKWVLYDNRKRSAQWLSKAQPAGRHPKPPLHPKKMMLLVWWSTAGIIHRTFLARGQTITAERYCAELHQMHQKLLQKQPALVNRHGVLLLQDNARPHVAQRTMLTLSALGYEALPHPAYSPDLSPTDYHLFRRLDHFLSGKQFTTDNEVQRAVDDFFGSQPQDFFRSGIMALPDRWQLCVDAEGDYFA